HVRAPQECAASPAQIDELVVGGGGGRDRPQGGGRGGGGVPGGGPHVGDPVRADVAIRVGQLGRPLNAVIAIVELVAVGVEAGSLGHPAAAHVLNDHDVTALGGPQGIESEVGELPEALAVGCAQQQDGVTTIPGRAVHVCAQDRTVAHWGRDIAF